MTGVRTMSHRTWREFMGRRFAYRWAADAYLADGTMIVRCLHPHRTSEAAHACVRRDAEAFVAARGEA